MSAVVGTSALCAPGVFNSAKRQLTAGTRALSYLCRDGSTITCANTKHCAQGSSRLAGAQRTLPKAKSVCLQSQSQAMPCNFHSKRNSKKQEENHSNEDTSTLPTSSVSFITSVFPPTGSCLRRRALSGGMWLDAQRSSNRDRKMCAKCPNGAFELCQSHNDCLYDFMRAVS